MEVYRSLLKGFYKEPSKTIRGTYNLYSYFILCVRIYTIARHSMWTDLYKPAECKTQGFVKANSHKKPSNHNDKYCSRKQYNITIHGSRRPRGNICSFHIIKIISVRVDQNQKLISARPWPAVVVAVMLAPRG